MYDATLLFAQKALKSRDILKTLGVFPKKYVFCTVHRAENTDIKDRLENILQSFEYLSKEFAVVLPLHPRTKKMISIFKLEQYLKTIKVINPASFLDMLCLEKNASLIITDSGGVQKEAYF